MKAFTFQSLKETIQLLQLEGYNADFSTPCTSLYCPDYFEAISLDQFMVDKHIEVKSYSTAETSFNLYALSSSLYKLKGYFVSTQPIAFA